MTIPDLDHDNLQFGNRSWWDSNPMTYDWQQTMNLETGTPEWFAEVDRRFYEAHREFGHPNWPVEPPFNQQIGYAARTGQQVLEVGCGMGGTAAAMARSGIHVSAVDLSSNAVHITRRRFDLENLDALVTLADGERLPFDDQSFDMVWSWGVIHHSAATEHIIKEMWRVMKPGAEVKVMVYHRHAIRNWITAGLNHGILRGEFLRRKYADILRDVTDGFIARHLTRSEFASMFEGFEAITTELTDYYDLSYVPGNRQVNKYLVGRVIPRKWKFAWDDWLIRNYGWFLYLEARKPANP